MLVWQVCLASVCLHIRRKSNCILCVLASRRVSPGAMFLLLSHSLVHHPLYHLGTAMHCPLVCPVSPMVMSEKEDADEDKGQGLQHGLEIAGE